MKEGNRSGPTKNIVLHIWSRAVASHNQSSYLPPKQLLFARISKQWRRCKHWAAGASTCSWGLSHSHTQTQPQRRLSFLRFPLNCAARTSRQLCGGNSTRKCQEGVKDITDSLHLKASMQDHGQTRNVPELSTRRPRASHVSSFCFVLF